MAAISYLLRKTVKNWVLDLKNKPQMLILIGVFAWMLIMSALRGNTGITQRSDPSLTSALFFVVALLFGGFALYGGMSETRTFFRMADVNLLFPAPLRPAQVILYGMVRNIGSLALAMLLLVYQIGTLRFSLGMSPSVIGWAFLCLFLALLLCLTSSMCLMLFCSGRPDRLAAVKYILLGVLALLLVYTFASARTMREQAPLQIFSAVCADPRLDYLPIVGWARGLFVALSTQNTFLALACGAPMAALFGVEVLGISGTKTDYYEDVLDGAARRETMLKAAREGRRGMAGLRLPKKEKTIRRYGINAGSGASVFYHKRMLERSRGTFGIVGATSLIIAVSGLFLGLVLHTPYMAFLIVAVTQSLIFRRVSAWEADLEKTYLYLTPARPEQKLLYILLPELWSAFLDGAIVLVVGAAFFKTAPFAAFAGALAFVSVCVLSIGSSLAVRRIFGNDTKNTLVQMVSIYLPMLLILVGLIPLIFLQMFLFGRQSGEPVFTYLLLAVWNVAVSALLLFLSKGVLGEVQ